MTKDFFMKKLLIFLFISFLGYSTVNAQRFRSFDRDWKASVGINAVGNLGSRNPVKDLGNYGFQFPIAVAIERQWNEQFALEQDLSLNGFKAGKYLNNGYPSKNLTYFSTNSNLKFYFGDYLFDQEWLDIYASVGVGLFYMSEMNASANLSGGFQFWLSDNIALRLQTTAKFAANSKNRQYANNHFQHVFQVVFRL